MADLTLIVPKNNILVESKKQEIKIKICNRLKDLNIDISKYKTDPQLILLIAELIEFLVNKKDYIDKQELLIMVISEFIGLDDNDKNIIKSSIDFVNKNKLIKKPSYYKLFICGIKELFFKKKP